MKYLVGVWGLVTLLLVAVIIAVPADAKIEGPPRVWDKWTVAVEAPYEQRYGWVYTRCYGEDRLYGTTQTHGFEITVSPGGCR